MAVPVTVRYWAGARRAAGRDSEEFHAADVAELLELVGSRSPELKRVVSASSVLVNAVHSGGRPLASGDVIDILPPFAGG